MATLRFSENSASFLAYSYVSHNPSKGEWAEPKIFTLPLDNIHEKLPKGDICSITFTNSSKYNPQIVDI